MYEDQEARDAPLPDWLTCVADGCIGIQLNGQDACLAHVGEEARKSHLAGLSPRASVDLRGTPISATLLHEVLAATRTERGVTAISDARFDHARFTEVAWFYRTQFTGTAVFDDALFTEDVWFTETRFAGEASFNQTEFTGDAEFREARFAEDAEFTGARFAGEAAFNQTEFTGDAWFDGAWFGANSWFDEVQFAGDADFTGVRFVGEASFNRTQFTGDAVFDHTLFTGDVQFDRGRFTTVARFAVAHFAGEAWLNQVEFIGDAEFTGARFATIARFIAAHFAGEARFDEAQFAGLVAWFDEAQFSQAVILDKARFSGDAWFGRSRFDQAQQLGPVLVTGLLRLDHAVFIKRVEIAAIAGRISCAKTQFSGGAALEVGFAAVALDDTQFLAPSRLVAVASHGFAWEQLRQVADPDQPGAFHPQLVSLRGTDVANLLLSNVNLRVCALIGAQNLQTLRAEVAGIPAPRGWHTGWAWLPLWRWTRRNALVEEHAWRATTRKRHRWTLPAHLAGSDAPDPSQLAAVYRALREGREASKDEPGAADFYYGEMEMRRKAPATPWSERFILWWYWLLAGYGLRGLRALGWLLALVAALAVMFSAVGFVAAHPSLWNSLVYTTQATLSLESKAKALSHQLSVAGELLRIVLRLSGPLLLGLALLSVRNRVKR